MGQHPSWNAVVDNYVFVHNAFRNDLAGMIAASAKGVDVGARFAIWKEALDVHSRIEDELFLPALQGRIGAEALPSSLTDASAYRAVDKLVDVALAAAASEQHAALVAVRDAILPHLEEEEREV